MDVAFWLSLAVFLVSILTFTEIAIGIRKVGLLRNVAPSIAGPTPRVSVVFSALNEAGTIEPALRSLLSLDYPNLEFIAINDRSTDDTGVTRYRLDELRKAHRMQTTGSKPPRQSSKA